MNKEQDGLIPGARTGRAENSPRIMPAISGRSRGGGPDATNGDRTGGVTDKHASPQHGENGAPSAAVVARSVESPYYTPEEAAEYLRLAQLGVKNPPQTMRTLIKRKRIRHCLIAGRVAFHRDHLDEYARQCDVPAAHDRRGQKANRGGARRGRS